MDQIKSAEEKVNQGHDQLVSDDMWVYGYTRIDNGVIYCKEINDSEFRTYCVVRSLVNQKKAVAWPSYETIAELSGHSKRTAMRNVGRLEELDLIQKIPRSGSSNYFMVKKKQNSSVLRNENDIQEWIGKNIPKEPEKPADPGKEEKVDPIPYKEIIDHLNGKAGKKFVHTADKHRKDIRARYNELKKAGMDHDVIISEFKRTIDVMVNNWTGKTFNGTPAEKYLQPSTLFGKKFDQYRNEEMEIRTSGQVGQAPAQDDWKKRFLEGDDE